MSTSYSDRLIDFIWETNGTVWANADMTWEVEQLQEHILGVDEAITMTDQRAAEVAKAISQTLSAGDAFDRVVVVSRGFGESLAFTGEFAKLFFKNHEDLIGADDALAKENTKEISEVALVGEQETDPTDYRRHYYENFQMADSIVKHLEKKRAHTVGVQSSFIGPNVPAVLSDIAVKTTELTDESIDEVTNKGSAFGFSTWMPFVDGEYYYREALFRMTVRNEETGTISSVRIPKHKVICDVYEIIDKGQSAISSSNTDGTMISFNKSFRQPPIVSMTASQSPDGFCIPQFATDGDGEPMVYEDHMYVKLVKPDDTLASGTVMWTAVGF